jgi:RimJ/RimL family protein N-acetyltransferase
MAAVQLEPFTASDIDRLIGWIPDASFMLQWAGPAFSWPLTRDQLEREVIALKPDGAHRMYRAVAQTNGVVGHIEIKAIDRVHSNAMIGRVLIAPLQHGQRLSEPMVEAALEVCFDELQLHRVALKVFMQNTAAVACYKRLGFVIEGTERQTRRAPNGEWWSNYTMAILAADWRAAK